MNKRLVLVASVLSLALLAPMNANGVEFGQDATGDPNAVHIMGNTSGFLYSERIIFTAAHVLNQVRVQPNGETNGFVYAPGVADKTGAKKYKIAKMFFPATYVNASSTTQPEDDFAIVVLQEDMPVKMRVQIATEAQMVQFATTRAKVEMVGYGLQSGNQRSNPQEDKRAPHKLSSYLYTPQMMNNFYATDGGRPAYWSKIEWGSIHTELLGSICSGDSGAGFYVDQDNTRYYVGTAGNGLGLSNCSPNGSVKMNPNGGMSWFPAPFKFLDLLKSAESFVTEEKRKEVARLEEARIAQELKVKQAANEKAKVEAELKAKLEAEEKAKAEADQKARLDADAKIAADLKAKLDAEAKIAAEAVAKVAADAALLAAVKKGQDLAKKLNLGKPCSKLKSAKTVADVKFVCVKKGKKLVWALR